MTEGKPYTAVSGKASTNYDTKWSKESVTVNNGTRYPRDIQKFSHDKDKYQPTQKPIALNEYLIKTYTDEGMLVLDNCMGSGSTGIACLNCNRDFIGIEKDDEIYEIAVKRINEHKQRKVG